MLETQDRVPVARLVNSLLVVSGRLFGSADVYALLHMGE